MVCGSLLIASLFLMVIYSVSPLFRFPTLLAQAMVVIGAGTSLWHYYLLKRHNQTLAKPQRLITQPGFYRWIRHPMYGADILSYTGLFLLMPNTVTLVILPVALLALTRQARKEDDYLERRFGRPYKRWEKQTWMILPFL